MPVAVDRGNVASSLAEFTWWLYCKQEQYLPLFAYFSQRCRLM